MNASDIQESILKAKQETKTLSHEVEVVRNQMKDTSLADVSKFVKSLSSDAVDLRLYNTLKGHSNKIAQVRWGGDSRSLLSASQDGYMIIWDAVTGFKKEAIALENQWVLSCAFSPNGRYAASGGLDNTVTLYSIESWSGKLQTSGLNGNRNMAQVFKGHKAYISDMDLLKDELLITASGDMTCMLWDINKGSRVNVFIDHLGDVLTLSKFPQLSGEDGPLFVSGSSDGRAKLWDSRKQSAVQSFTVSNSDVNCVKTFPGGYVFAAGSDDGNIRLFDLRSDCEICQYSLAESVVEGEGLGTKNDEVKSLLLKPNAVDSNYDTPGVVSLDFSRSGRLLYSCYANSGCVIWDTLKAEIVGKLGFASHGNRINQVSVCPDGTGLCTASWDQTIKIWSV